MGFSLICLRSPDPTDLSAAKKKKRKKERKREGRERLHELSIQVCVRLFLGISVLGVVKETE
jgi:hypothetical protein